jgi:hypothetical protein
LNIFSAGLNIHALFIKKAAPAPAAAKINLVQNIIPQSLVNQLKLLPEKKFSSLLGGPIKSKYSQGEEAYRAYSVGYDGVNTILFQKNRAFMINNVKRDDERIVKINIKTLDIKILTTHFPGAIISAPAKKDKYYELTFNLGDMKSIEKAYEAWNYKNEMGESPLSTLARMMGDLLFQCRIDMKKNKKPELSDDDADVKAINDLITAIRKLHLEHYEQNIMKA